MQVVAQAFHRLVVGNAVLGGILQQTHVGPLLPFVVGSHAPPVVVVPHQAGADGGGQLELELTLARIARGVGNAGRGVGGDDLASGVAANLVAETIGGTQRQTVFLAETGGELYAEVNLVVAHVGRIELRQRGAGLSIGVHHRAVVAAPEVAAVHTERDSAERLPSHTDEHLVQAAVALIDGGIAGRAFGADSVCDAIVVADVREWYHAEREAQVARHTKAGNGIFEVGTTGVDALVAFLEIRNLAGETEVEDERERVDGGIGCRVQVVHLCMIAIGNA